MGQEDMFGAAQSRAKSSSNDFEATTKYGYELKQVRSNLQKCIRYGDEVHALFWAAEMHEGGYTNYLLTTFACIAVEDIGYADPATLSAIMATCNFYKALYKEKKRKAEYTPMVGTLVTMMCRARKSRIGDNSYQYVSEKRLAGWRLDHPEFGLDEHTVKGRAKGRWYRFWVRVGSVLQNKASFEEIGGRDYEEEMNEFWIQGHPSHQDEPDYEKIDVNNPYAPIIEKLWTGDIAESIKEEEKPEPKPEVEHISQEEKDKAFMKMRTDLSDDF